MYVKINSIHPHVLFQTARHLTDVNILFSACLFDVTRSARDCG